MDHRQRRFSIVFVLLMITVASYAVSPAMAGTSWAIYDPATDSYFYQYRSSCNCMELQLVMSGVGPNLINEVGDPGTGVTDASLRGWMAILMQTETIGGTCLVAYDDVSFMILGIEHRNY
jgi:hypothetical protein